MASVRVRNLTIGEGVPKICVPIVAKTTEEIINEAASFIDLELDLVEWRIDWFEGIEDIDAVVTLTRILNETLGTDVPLLCTIRTASNDQRRGLLRAQSCTHSLRRSRPR